MKRNLMSELTEGIEALAEINKRQKEIRQQLAHIKKPYSLKEILDQYSEGDYNAELLLQHALLLLLTNNYRVV